jgi:HK97 family phage major capsid protein
MYSEKEVAEMLNAIAKANAELRGTVENRMDSYDKELDESQKALKAVETVVARAGALPGGWASDYPSVTTPTASGRWAVDIQSRKIPILAKGDRLSASYPRPSEGGDWSIGDFVRGSMGLNVQASVLERGVSTVPLYIGSQIIDMVREKARILQAGAITIPLPDGPMNLCRIVSDPTVSEHTEAADDITESIPVFTPVSLDPKTLAVLIPLSLEIVQDSPNLDAALRQSISSAFALKLDQLGIAAILADTSIPDSATSEVTDAWAGTLKAVGSMLALNQGLPKACICGPGDYIARAGQLASTGGQWLGAPPILKDMLDLETVGMTDGFAILGNFELGAGLAVRQALTLEMIRWGKPGFGSHILVAFARMGIYVLQPNHLYNQVDTVA